MRILLWHGYLLGGTGSNVYTRSIAREWSRAGHEVIVVCQEPHAELYDLGGAAVVRPDIGGLLPVFVLDRYEGLEAKLLPDLTAVERGNQELADWGREALAGASAVFVGSEHIREVLEDVVGHVDRVHEVPPGVDVDEFRPVPRDEALARLLDEFRRDPPNPRNANERLPDEGNAERLGEFFRPGESTVLYFGKLLRNKGVHLLLEAL